MPTDAAALAANFGIVSTGGKGAFSMPVFAKTICSTLKPSHMPRHRWVKGLFFLFESQCLWTAVPAKEFLRNFSKGRVSLWIRPFLTVLLAGAHVELSVVFSHIMVQRFLRTAALNSPTLQHAPVGCVRNSIDVGWHFVPLLSLVHVNNLL